MPSLTINYPAGDGARFADALGKVLALKDQGGAPRNATAAECKAWLIGRAQQLIEDVEGSIARKAAADAVIITPLDMT